MVMIMLHWLQTGETLPACKGRYRVLMASNGRLHDGRLKECETTDWSSMGAGLRLGTFSLLLAMVLSTTCGRPMWKIVRRYDNKQ